MSWRESTGRESCNRCRHVVDLGAAVYVGPRTGAFYCEGCAGELFGKTIDGQTVPKVLPVGMDSFDAKVMGQKLREAIQNRRRGLYVVGGE